jgi:hypothetical protein
MNQLLLALVFVIPPWAPGSRVWHERIAADPHEEPGEPVRVVITLPADFPARIRRVTPELSVQAFVRAATEEELTGLEGTLHVGGKG